MRHSRPERPPLPFWGQAPVCNRRVKFDIVYLHRLIPTFRRKLLLLPSALHDVATHKISVQILFDLSDLEAFFGMTRATVRELEKKKIKLKGILNKEDVRT
jgi:hypothetical protein